MPSIYELIEPLRRELASAWLTAPLDVLAQIQAWMRVEGEELQIAELALYTAGTLVEVLEELASVRLEKLAAREAITGLRFRVCDPTWVAHLAIGDAFDSTAYP